MIKFSKAGKMPCRSWSLQALITCPAAKQKNGELVDACKGCYATTGNYNFPNVKAPRVHNGTDWKRNDFVADFVAELDNDRYFRWFDSGDMYTLKLAEKMLEIMIATPWVKHWLPTRMHKFPKFAKVIAKMQALPNVVVRLSGDSINGIVIDGETVSTIIPFADDEVGPTTKVCDAYERDGKCGSCRMCWDKETQVIAYPAHGVKMKRIIAKQIAA